MESETKKIYDSNDWPHLQPVPLWKRALEWLKPVLVMAVAWALVMLALSFFTGCGLVQRETPIADKAGNALYVDRSTGKATTQATDPAGNPNERATLPTSTGTVEQGVEIGRGVSGMLPPPGGLIAEIVLAGGAAAFYAALKAARRKRLEEYGLTEEDIAEDKELRAKVEARASHQVKQRIATIARKRKASPTGTPG